MQLPEKILYVDDDADIRRSFERAMTRRGFEVDLAKDAWAAMKLTKRNQYAVVAIDYEMPGLNGFDLKDELKAFTPHVSFVLVSGVADLDLTIEAINEHGVAFVVLKPWNPDELASVLNRAAEATWERLSATRIAERAVEVHRAHADLKSRFGADGEVTPGRAVVRTLTDALGLRDPLLRDHAEAVARYARVLAKVLGVEDVQMAAIEAGALLHDVGKLGLPEALLNKSDALSQSGQPLWSHPEKGARLLEGIPGLEEARQIIIQHHERVDGSGYPHAIAGHRICVGARIIAVADAIDDMLTDRSHCKGVSLETVRAQLIDGAGRQFDAEVVQAFVAIPVARWLEGRVSAVDGGAAAA